jgi:hypothetical protein
MPPWTIGCSMPKSSVIRVLISISRHRRAAVYGYKLT